MGCRRFVDISLRGAPFTGLLCSCAATETARMEALIRQNANLLMSRCVIMRVEWLNVFHKDSIIMQEMQNFLKIFQMMAEIAWWNG